DVPDLSRYRQLRVLSKQEFPIHDSSRRIIVVGDIHGTYDRIQHLLSSLSYDSSTDTLLHVGDILTKGTHEGSLDFLSFASSNSIIGVRGNQDQKVIEWRSWIEWVLSKQGGKTFLQATRLAWEAAKMQSTIDPESSGYGYDHDRAYMNKAIARWWRRVPVGWTMFTDAYMLAHDMTPDNFEYLVNLPIKIYVPHAHLFLVHGGLVSHDTLKDADDPSQPLARAPKYSKLGSSGNAGAGEVVMRKGEEEAMREKQERAVLDLAPNNDPYVPLNIRSVEADGTLTRSKGTPWSDLWNEDMELCRGFDVDDDDDDATMGTRQHHHHDRSRLPCLPMSIVYGHAASRGLDIKRWSLGLDSGCVKGNRLSALVVGGNETFVKTFGSHHRTKEDFRQDKEEVPFGDSHVARIYSVSCNAYQQ
ncbi:hypothetical protein AMATHDRAFT_138714, partial [Amanita thiersii Skay4041]